MAGRHGKHQARRGGGMKYGLVLVLGLLLGLGLAAAYLVFGDREPLDALLPRPDPQARAQPTPRDSEPVAQEPAAAARPSFDFYTLLPERQVELPGVAEPESPATPAAPPAAALPPGQAPAASPSPGQAGLLQAGAFSSAADAEAMRARLALLGRVARIETVQVDGRTLHRVRLGPFADAAERQAAQQALAEAGIPATVVR